MVHTPPGESRTLKFLKFGLSLTIDYDPSSKPLHSKPYITPYFPKVLYMMLGGPGPGMMAPRPGLDPLESGYNRPPGPVCPLAWNSLE